MPVVQFSGLASGIDGQAITEALIDAQRLASAPLENKVTANEEETTALEEFNTLLLTLDSQVADFLTFRGGAVDKNARSTNEDAVSAVASSDAAAATTTINVLNLARSATVSFDDRFTSVDQPIAPGLTGPGSISINVGSGDELTTVDVPITSTTTLSGLVQAITDALPGKAQASFVNAGTETNPEYALLIQGVESGVELGTMSVSVSGNVAAEGILQGQNVLQAEDAVVEVSGIGQVRRAKNQINNLIPGVSLDLKQAGTGPTTISVSSDATKTAEKVANMVEAFNAIVEFSEENDRIERVESENGVTNVFGDLARTRVDDQAIDSLRRALSSSISSVPDSIVRTMADLGITTERDGKLKFDESTFLEAVGKDPQSSEQLLQGFADRIGSAEGTIAQYTRFNGLIDTAKNSNKNENDSINKRLERLEQNLERQRESLNLLYSRLESRVSDLNSQGEALNNILAGL